MEGLRDACLALGVPVVGGNVSLYNEGGEGPIYPTPIVGMVGRLPDPERVPRAGFAEQGHAIALVGPVRADLEGSELEKLRGRLAGGLPAVDLRRRRPALAALRAAVRGGGLATAHDISEGGLACALAECCIAGGIGARVDLPRWPRGHDGPASSARVPAARWWLVRRAGRAARRGPSSLGEVGGDACKSTGCWTSTCRALHERFEGAIPAAFA